MAGVTMRRNLRPGLHTKHGGHVASGRIDKQPPDFDAREWRGAPVALGGGAPRVGGNRLPQESFPHPWRWLRLRKRECELGCGFSEGAGFGLADFAIG